MFWFALNELFATHCLEGIVRMKKWVVLNINVGTYFFIQLNLCVLEISQSFCVCLVNSNIFWPFLVGKKSINTIYELQIELFTKSFFGLQKILCELFNSFKNQCIFPDLENYSKLATLFKNKVYDKYLLP